MIYVYIATAVLLVVGALLAAFYMWNFELTDLCGTEGNEIDTNLEEN